MHYYNALIIGLVTVFVCKYQENNSPKNLISRETNFIVINMFINFIAIIFIRIYNFLSIILIVINMFIIFIAIIFIRIYNFLSIILIVINMFIIFIAIIFIRIYNFFFY